MTKATLLDSITKLTVDHRGAVLVCGSHGGLYPGYLAAKGGARAVILHDAGVGRDRAGIASLAYLAELGIAAATVGHDSARIGDAADMLFGGRISHANGAAAALGVAPGMACAQAADLLDAAPAIAADPPPYSEGRQVQRHASGADIVLIDSAAMVRRDEDRGRVIVTGSHGGLLGGDDWMALQADGLLGAYNDAGIGKDKAGIGRLPALERRGIAGVTVAAASARIGEARSTFHDGMISALNGPAGDAGAAIGLPLADFIDRLLVRAD